MRTIATSLFISISLISLTSCAHKATNPQDPFEPINRPINVVNTTLDGFILRPVARVYKSVLPPPIRAGINHFYDNIYMIPTVANDLLQGKWRAASDGAGRFVINSTIGIGGLFDPATMYHIPLHKNDLGLTLAHWGWKNSAYIVIPLLGPSTIRDGIGMAVEYTFLTPYPYINDDFLLNTLLIVRAVDLRSQYLENDKLLQEALDPYSFLRDAYLQNRNYLINGGSSGVAAAGDDDKAASILGDGGADYVDE